MEAGEISAERLGQAIHWRKTQLQNQMSNETKTQLPRCSGSPALPCSRSSDTPEADEFYKGEKISDDQIFAQKLERERNTYKAAIVNCLDWANGRQSEWGERAENAFAFLDAALYPIPENAE